MKKVNFAGFWPVALILLMLTHQQVVAFSDIFEPDDSVEQANIIVIDDNKRQQHTLHSREDEDWFKFYARSKNSYEITINPVGSHIDVAFELYESDGITLIKEVNKLFKGKKEFLKWSPPSDGIYYVKVSDTAPESENCRLNIQYQLQVSRGIALEPGQVQGIVTDVRSGKPLEGAIVYTNCNDNDTSISFEDGNYRLIHNCPSGLYELTIEAIGYRSLTCHTPIPEIVSIQRDMALLPDGDSYPALTPAQLAFRNGDTLRASQPVYHNGEQVKVDFKLYRLPPYICMRYYVGIAYPDGRFFIVTELNQFEPFDWQVIPLWKGIGNTVIDKPIDNNWPRGDYQLYLLRMHASIEEPMNHLDNGELNVTTFRVE